MKKLLLIFALLCSASAFGQVGLQAGACTTQKVTASGVVATMSITCTPNAANHGFVIFAVCGGSTVTAGAIAGTGWTFTAMSPVTGTNATTGWIKSWAALTPSTSAVTITVTWTLSSGNCNFGAIQAVELTGVDTTGGATTFYAHGENKGTTGGCVLASVTSTSANDAVVGSCFDSVSNIAGFNGAGYTAIQQDASGDGSEFKVATGSQTPTWNTSTGAFTNSTIAVKASGGGVTKTCTLTLMGAGPC